MDSDKPFACTAPSCSMRFTNEDHLTVHRKKHEMLLSLNMETTLSKCNSASAVFVDQTPTPTRFIRNCEDVGLFQDLQSMNPFEEQFRKAVEVTRCGTPQTVESLQIGSDIDVLNTPSVLPTDLDADTCGTNINEDATIHSPIEKCDSSKAGDELNIVDSKESASISPKETAIVEVATVIIDDEVNTIEANSACYNATTSFSPSVMSSEDGTSSDVLSVMHQAVASSPPLDNHLSNIPDTPLVIKVSEEDGVPTVSDSLTMDDNLSQSLHSSSKILPQIKDDMPLENASTAGNGNIVQLILRLPDGQTLPVHIPTLPVLTTSATTTSSESRKLTCIPSNIMAREVVSSRNQRNSFAKLKLRQSLNRNKSNSTSEPSSDRQIWFSSETLNLDSTSNGKLNNALGRKRGAEEDPDEKRQRFLERNRAAAIRCRQKRKQWIQSLESKADELSAVNQQLQNEVSMLRDEVAHLKSMLLAHKDCPVTQQQQKQMVHLNGIFPNSAFIVSASNGEIQRSAAEAIATSALTNLAGSDDASLDHSSASESLSPVVLRTFVTREQAVALLTLSSNIPEKQSKTHLNSTDTETPET